MKLDALTALKPPLQSAQTSGEHQLALEYAPILMMDRHEPFRPVAVGYTVFTENGPSPSFPRHVQLEAERGHGTAPGTGGFAVEYAFWWDWDIQHLYELEHAWVYVDNAGRVTKVEASWHGEYSDMRLDEADGAVLKGKRPVLYVKPGKHAFAPVSSGFDPVRDEILAACSSRAGLGGVWVTPLFAGMMPAKSPLADRLVHTHLERHQFVPTFDFGIEDTGESWKFVPWATLAVWIPERVSYLVEQLKRMYQPHERRWLRIAHRGASEEHVENGATALRKAAELGADMVEIDVRLSSDGVAVVFHDEKLERVTTGRGLVSEHSLAELRRVKLRNEQTGETLDEGVLTLDEAIGLCREEGLGLYIDIKDGRAVDAVVDCIRRHDWQRRTIVGTSDPDVLTRFRQLEPAVETAWLVGWPSDPIAGLLEELQRIGATYLHPCWENAGPRPDTLLSADDVALVHAAGKGIVTWHEERVDVIAGLRQLGVDGVCSNRPELLI